MSLTAFAASPQTATITGKQGWITINSNTKFGDQVLTPGTYYFSHETEGNCHFMSFQKVGDPLLALQYSDEGLVGPPINVDCQMENLTKRVKKTVVTTVPDGKEPRITRIQIKGENVEHDF